MDISAAATIGRRLMPKWIAAFQQRGHDTGKSQRTQVREASRSRASDSPSPGEGTTPEWLGQAKNSVKVSLTVGQVLRLFCICGRCNLFTAQSIHSTENAMTNEILTARVAQALLAITATSASVLVVQFAMLVG